MRIEALNENSFYILLSHEDMKELGISFEELDYSNIETRRVIWTLLEEARNALKRDIDPRSKMLIEVFKGETGCKIEFTLSKNDYTGKLKIKKESPTITALFKDFNRLCAFTDIRVLTENETEKTELFKYRDGYALILSPKPEFKGKLRLVLSEYAFVPADSLLSEQLVREYGSLIFRGKLPPQGL